MSTFDTEKIEPP